MAPFLNVSFDWPVIAVCVIVDMITGALWYGPLFGDVFAAGVREHRDKSIPFPDENINMLPALISSIVAGVMQTIFLAHTLPHLLFGVEENAAIVLDPVHAVVGAAWLWLGFKLSSYVEEGMWKQTSIGLIFVDAARQLLRLCTIALILSGSQALQLTLNGTVMKYPED
eukprot:m.19635 g.19635  ORF g.19635 m.19635 type:complete len:169 (+) comp10935_c0_seq1:63-569(+)